LLDKDHLTDQLKAPTHKAHIPASPTEAEFQTLVEEFFHESTYVAKHLGRGDLIALKYNLDQAMKQINLRWILEWRIEIDHHWSVNPGAYGKGLRKLLSGRSGGNSNRRMWGRYSKIIGTLCSGRFLCSAR
jgi:aminoglycoside 6-adenylyltransferase